MDVIGKLNSLGFFIRKVPAEHGEISGADLVMIEKAFAKKPRSTKNEPFKYKTLAFFPEKIAGITLLDEKPGFTGIYLRAENGGLWPARLVNKSLATYDIICNQWLKRPGAIDTRSTLVRMMDV